MEQKGTLYPKDCAPYAKSHTLLSLQGPCDDYPSPRRNLQDADSAPHQEPFPPSFSGQKCRFHVRGFQM